MWFSVSTPSSFRGFPKAPGVGRAALKFGNILRLETKQDPACLYAKQRPNKWAVVSWWERKQRRSRLYLLIVSIVICPYDINVVYLLRFRKVGFVVMGAVGGYKSSSENSMAGLEGGFITDKCRARGEIGNSAFFV